MIYLFLLKHYVEDNTMYSFDKNDNIVINSFRHDFAIISEWFYKSFTLIDAIS